VYHGVGAGPGPTITYLVDLPLPWGRDTEVTLPIDQLVSDSWTAMEPRMDAAIAKGAVAIAAATALAIGMAAWWIRSSK